QEVADAQGVVGGHGQRQRAVDGRDLFDDQRRGGAVEVRAAVALGYLQTEQPQLCQRADDGPGEDTFGVTLDGAGSDDPGQDLAQGTEDGALVVTEIEPGGPDGCGHVVRY